MTSSPEPSSTGRFDGEDAAARIWLRRSPGTPAVPFAAALTGVDVNELTDALSIALAASDEARRLLDGMELRIRTLKTGIATSSVRCEHSVRGPVQWAETITARANALGNEDVFVCSAATRTFDTVENRVLVAALDAIARAAKALRGPVGEKVPVDARARVLENATEARHWRAHPRLAAVRGGRLSGRDAARLRGGHRLARLAPVIAVRQRVAEPFQPEDLHSLSDDETRRYQAFILEVVDTLAGRGLLPDQLGLVDGTITAGGLTLRHPSSVGSSRPGLAYRNVPLLPPVDLIGSAPWAAGLPERGITVGSAADIHRLLDRLADRDRERGTPQPSTSSS
jgi:hypothetical protein